MTNKGLKSTVDKGGQLEVLQYGTNMSLDYLLYYKKQSVLLYCTSLYFHIQTTVDDSYNETSPADYFFFPEMSKYENDALPIQYVLICICKTGPK